MMIHSLNLPWGGDLCKLHGDVVKFKVAFEQFAQKFIAESKANAFERLQRGRLELIKQAYRNGKISEHDALLKGLAIKKSLGESTDIIETRIMRKAVAV